ncbi:pyridoxal phosphate-dependent decarboxylase family protein [Vallitalea okinawensis]|uniref:pyridoxal phosphate-dependent decarboxylase family protein n=1 Tax=Vallitalea okinawensis TaxID=2078660 RepID=UPI000CFDC05B|nr:aminotransferase class V-fold PLP-dependent enzyme [Vallitalea okinawensis]
MQHRYRSKILDEIRNHSLDSDLKLAHQFALDYINNVDDMPVFPKPNDLDSLKVFDSPLGDEPEKTEDILTQLHQYGSPATVAQTGGRYFGFVCGGILPSALASKWLTDAWDQNPAMYVLSPVASKIEAVTEKWLIGLLGLPPETVAGYVSGSSTATIIGLTIGRNYLLKNLGYDVFGQGLFNAPEIKVVLGEGAHSTIYKALSIIGLGNERIHKVPCDDQGRIQVDQMPPLDHKTLLILQAGHVNTGNFDDFQTLCTMAKEAGAYVHVDGAFGLWAAANPEFKHLTDGVQLADSWSVDGHKTLNTPYDSGIILCRHRQLLINSMHMVGSYIILSEDRDNMLYTSEMSRRTRAIDLWATLKGLGRKGVAELVWELHKKAVYFGDLLKEGGLDMLNDIVFNQVLVRFKSDEKTDTLIKMVQDSGVCWLGGAKWQGQSVMRISVSSYKTTYEDIDTSAEDILRLARELDS